MDLSDFNTWIIPFAFLMFTIILLAIKFIPNFFIRGYLTISFIFVLILGGISYIQLMSTPKPMSMEWIKSELEAAEIVGASIIPRGEDQGIYLWLKLGNPYKEETFYMMPFYYAIPYNEQMAQQLQKGIEESKKYGTPLVMRSPFDNSWENRQDTPRFHSDPPEKWMPPKGGRQNEDHQFRGPRLDI